MYSFMFILRRPRLFLSAARLLLLGVVVQSLQKDDDLNVHGLREHVHSHGSNRTERGPVNSVGWRSAQAEQHIPASEANLCLRLTDQLRQTADSLDEVLLGCLGIARHINQSLQVLRPPDGKDHLGIC